MTAEANGQPVSPDRTGRPVTSAPERGARGSSSARRLLWIALCVLPNFALAFFIAERDGIWPAGCGTAGLVALTLGCSGHCSRG